MDHLIFAALTDTHTMSNSGNFNKRSGYDIPSNLPTEVEQDGEHAIETQTTTFHTNIGQNYSERHPLVTGGSHVYGQHPSIFRKDNNDIVPEISNIYDGYKSEAKRLETFYDWPSNAPVRKEDLARNGFIYMHAADRAQCIFCRGVLSSWESGDIVENEHKKHCPECPFAYGYECGNIPLPRTLGITLHRYSSNSSPQPQFYLPNQTQSFNTTVKIPVQSSHGERSHPNDSLNRPDSRPYNLSSLGSLSSLPSVPSGQSLVPGTAEVTTNEPKYRDWGDEYKRVRSFKGWPTQMSQTPLDLANAGLLYMGK